ncbi:MAG: hypothetical protein LBT89_12085 [Planctomycetaceae bacterium]|nr:hypothetical protein [Planctomycetaceae bacterium]
MPYFRLLLSVVVCFSIGCKSSNQVPSNPFAVNRTVPPPATFSSQEAYLGQSPLILPPQTPASVFPGAAAAPPANTTLPPLTSAAENAAPEAATLFQSANVQPSNQEIPPEPEWSPANVAVTSQTAFQNLETKTNTVSYQDGSGTLKTVSETTQNPVTSSSQIVTEIKDGN